MNDTQLWSRAVGFTRSMKSKKPRQRPGAAAPRNLADLRSKYIVLQRRLQAVHVTLAAQTQILVAAGFGTQDLVWLLTPGECAAMRMSALTDQAHDRDLDLLAQLEAIQECCPPQHLSCVYVGPEGLLFTHLPVTLVDGPPSVA